MTKLEAIESILENLDETTLIQVWNNYCAENGNTEDMILSNDENTINEEFDGRTPFEVVTGIDKYNINDNYISNGIYGIRSFNDAFENVCISDLARAVIREETILTDSTEESDWEDDIIECFEEFLMENGKDISDLEDEFDADEILTRPWDDGLLSELDEDE